MILYMAAASPSWLLLIVSLPTSSATARMRIWRTLKAIGCTALRDGAYLLPAQAGREQDLQELADECTREGGVAWLLSIVPRSTDEDAAYRQLFDRAEDYAELRKSWKEANRGLKSLSSSNLARLPRKLPGEYEAGPTTDYCPGEAS